MRTTTLAVAGTLLLATAGTATASTSHEGWPVVDGAHLRMARSDAGATFAGSPGAHNKLLGGHGSDTLRAGRIGDVLWGDYHPSGQGEAQVDRMSGGAGKDFIYASHGRNVITTGGGLDQVHAHFGRGSITCANPKATVFLSHKSQKRYVLHGCPRISYKSVGH